MCFHQKWSGSAFFKALNGFSTSTSIGLIFLNDLAISRAPSTSANTSKPQYAIFRNFQVSQLSLYTFDAVPNSLNWCFTLLLLDFQPNLNKISESSAFFEKDPGNLRHLDVLRQEDLWILSMFHLHDSSSSTRCLIFFNQIIHFLEQIIHFLQRDDSSSSNRWFF